MAIKTEITLDVTEFKRNLDSVINEGKRAGEQIANSFKNIGKGSEIAVPKVDSNDIKKLVDSYKSAKVQASLFLAEQKDIAQAMTFNGQKGTAAFNLVEKNIKEAQKELERFNDTTDKTTANTTKKTGIMSNAFSNIMSGLTLGGGVAVAQKGLELVSNGITELWEQSKRADEISTNMEIGFRNAGLTGEELAIQIENSEIAARKLGFAIGVAPERLKELAALSGTLGGATGKMNDDMVKAAIGIEKATGGMIKGEGAIRLFSKGISDPENAEALNKLKSQFPALANELSKVTDPAKKVTGALDFLGGTFTALENDMSDADAKMQNFKNIASEMAQGFGGNILAAFDVNSILDMFGEADIESLLSSLKNAGTQIGVFLTGAVQTLITYIKGAWEYLNLAFVEPLKGLGAVLIKLFEPIGELIKEVFGGGGESALTFSNIMKGLGNVVGFFVDTALIPLKFGLEGISYVTKALVWVVQLAKKNFEEFQTNVNNIKNAFNEWWNEGGAVVEVLKDISKFFTDIFDWGFKAGQTVSKFFGTMRQGLQDLLGLRDEDMVDGQWDPFNLSGKKGKPKTDNKEKIDAMYELAKKQKEISNKTAEVQKKNKEEIAQKEAKQSDENAKKAEERRKKNAEERKKTEQAISDFLILSENKRNQNVIDAEKVREQLKLDALKSELDAVKSNADLVENERLKITTELTNKIVAQEFAIKEAALEQSYANEYSLIVDNAKKQLDLAFITEKQKADINLATDELLKQSTESYLEETNRLYADSNETKLKNQRAYAAEFLKTFTLFPTFAPKVAKLDETSKDIANLATQAADVGKIFAQSFTFKIESKDIKERQNAIKTEQKEFLDNLQSKQQSYADYVAGISQLDDERIELEKNTQSKILDAVYEGSSLFANALSINLDIYTQYTKNIADQDQKLFDKRQELDKLSLKDKEGRAKVQVEIDRIVEDSKYQEYEAAVMIAEQTKSLFGEQTAAYKAFAIAQATIATYVAANKAYDSLAAIPLIGPALAAISAGVIIAAGLANVAKIAGIGFKTGGYTGDGNSNDVAGVVHKNEYVMNESMYKEHQGLIKAIESNNLSNYVVNEFGELLSAKSIDNNARGVKLNGSTVMRQNYEQNKEIATLNKTIDNLTDKIDMLSNTRYNKQVFEFENSTSISGSDIQIVTDRAKQKRIRRF